MSQKDFYEAASDTAPRAEAHQNIFVSLRAQPCSNVHSVLADERCIFVQETEECRESAHYIDYMDFMYCTIDSSNVFVFALAVVGLMMLALIIAMIVHHLCVNRYVDSVLYVAKACRLNECIAGVTLLTYGNGLPQVLSVLKHHTTGDTELIYNLYFGTAVYQASFLAALVIWMRRFYIYPEVIVPNMLFLVSVAILLEQMMFSEYVGIMETASLGVSYIAYLGTMYMAARLMDRERNRSRSEIEVRDITGKPIDIALTVTAPNITNDTVNSWCKRTWDMLRTFRDEDYRNARWCEKLYLLCTIPAEVIAILLLPRANYLLPLHGWRKCMFVLNLNLFPMFLICTAFVDMLSIKELSWCCLGSFTTTAVLSVPVCISTRQDEKPSFFTCIGLFAVFGTSYFIMLFTYELVAILETLSVIAGVSSASFATTILSWSSCWIDLIALITLAKRGFPRLAFTAALGAPLFNILIGLCSVFCVQMIREGATKIHVRSGTSGATSSVYLVMITLTVLLSVVFTRFQARTSLALCLTTLYFIFFWYTVFCEMEITHGYGTDHNDDGEYFQDRIPHHGQ